MFPVYRGGPLPSRDHPGRALDVLDARGRQARRSRQARAGAAQRSRAAPRGPTRLRRVPGLLDARRTALPRQRDRRRRGRGDGAQLRRGGRAPHGRRRRAGSGAARSDLRRDDRGRGARCRQRDRSVARHAATARGAGRRAVRPALERRARHAAPRGAVVVGAHDPARPGSRHLRLRLGGDAPARYDGHAVRGRPGGRGGDGGRHRHGALRGGGGGGCRRPGSRPRAGDVRRAPRAAAAPTARPWTRAARLRSSSAAVEC